MEQRGFPALLVAGLATGLGSSFVIPFLTLWGTRVLGLTESGMGWYMTATMFAQILVGTLLARWSDTHVPRKVMLLVGGFGAVVGYGTYAFVINVHVLLAVGCTILALATLCFSQLFAFSRERYYEREVSGLPRGFLLSVLRASFSVSWMAGPSISAWVLIGFGFPGIFLGAAALYIVYLICIAAYVPYEPHAPHVRARVREPVWRILLRGDIVAMAIAFTCIFAAHAMNVLNLPLMITNVLGGTDRNVGIVFGIGPLVEIPLMLWFGHLAARGHTLALLRFVGVATAVYFVLLNRVQAPWHIYFLQFFHGMSFAIISNVGILFFQDLVPGQAGLATTIYVNAANAGNLLGFFCFGTLVEPFGNRGLFLASAALTVIMAIIMFAYRPRPTATNVATA
jgi:SET family sugar efflux transporter-like MFS transporter